MVTTMKAQIKERNRKLRQIQIFHLKAQPKRQERLTLTASMNLEIWL
jgi:hypothetical protein